MHKLRWSPDREMLLVNVVIANFLNDLSVDVDVRNVNVAVHVCAAVDLSIRFSTGIV
jgi:hypothetical protein